VGRVVEVRIEPGKPFATVVVNPNARLDRAREVLLVWTLPTTSAQAAQGEGGLAPKINPANNSGTAPGADARAGSDDRPGARP